MPMEQFATLYRRSKIGFNIHNRGKYTVGNFRLFELPANGVMQVSDGGEYLSQFFEPGREIILADETDAMISRIDYYLTREKERHELARAGYRAVMSRHRFKPRMSELESLVRTGMRIDREARGDAVRRSMS